MTLDGKPWFVTNDVLRALDTYIYDDKPNTSAAIRLLSEDEFRTEGMTRIHPWPFSSRVKVVSLISEAGLYRLIMRSDKPQAQPFQDWVNREVLPSIRKTGSYELPKGEVMPVPADIASGASRA